MGTRVIARDQLKSAAVGVLATAIMGCLVVLGSRNLNHFDAALVGYTFATLFATFGIAYRYAVWLNRPPTRMYWRRGWQMFLRPKLLGRNLAELARRFFLQFCANLFIWKRGRERGIAHLLLMWGCIAAANRQPHMISQCATPRSRPRRKMKRFAATSTSARRVSVATFGTSRRRVKNVCQPRRQYIRVGGRFSHIE